MELFHFTTEPLTKLVPFTVRGKAASPAVLLVGFKLVVVGTGLVLLMVNVRAGVEVPPPGAGLNTVTPAVPTEVMSDAVMEAVSCVEFT